MVVDNKLIAQKWYSTYARAKAYYKENGNLDVPARYVDPVTGTKLGAWIANQRYARRPGSKNQTITPEQIRLLDEIGMNWGREGGNMDAWDEYIERISAYKEAHGDCRVPKAYVDPKDGYKLGKLVSTLRSINRGTDARSIPAGYKEKLDELGFFWGKSQKEISQDNWERGYAALKEFLEFNGDRSLLEQHAFKWRGFPLGAWLATQKYSYRGTSSYAPLSKTRLKALQKLGIDFSSTTAAFSLIVHDLTVSTPMLPPTEHPVLVYMPAKTPCWREGIRETDTQWIVAGESFDRRSIKAWAELPEVRL